MMTLYLTYVAGAKCIRTRFGRPPCTCLHAMFLLYQQQQCSSNDSSLGPARRVHTKIQSCTSSRFLMICERIPYFRPNRRRNRITAPPRTGNETSVLETCNRSAGTDFYSSCTHVPGLAAPTAQEYSYFPALGPDVDDRGSRVPSFEAAAPDCGDRCSSVKTDVCCCSSCSSHSSSTR